MEVGLMVVNNVLFLLLWWIFFCQFKDVDCWKFRDMMLLLIVGHGGYGLMEICFGGVKRLANTILRGDLDLFMSQPKNLLLHVTGSRSYSKGWGHLMTAMLLAVFGRLTDGWVLSLLGIGLLSSCLIFTSMSVLAHSLVFWFGPIAEVSKKYCEALYLFSLYPSNIYSGLLQVVLFTLIPAGMITYLPVELVRNFSLGTLCGLLGGALFFTCFSFFIFFRGLKRYESGNCFGGRGL